MNYRWMDEYIGEERGRLGLYSTLPLPLGLGGNGLMDAGSGHSSAAIGSANDLEVAGTGLVGCRFRFLTLFSACMCRPPCPSLALPHYLARPSPLVIIMLSTYIYTYVCHCITIVYTQIISISILHTFPQYRSNNYIL